MDRVRSACSFVSNSRIADVAVAIVALILTINVGAIYGPPHVRPFFEGDPTISYPKVASETVDFAQLCIFSALLPTLTAVIVPLAIRAHVGWNKPIKPVTDAWLSFSTIITAGSITAFITTYLKRYAGRPRPNFFALCQYEPFIEATQTYGVPHHFGSLSNCTGSEFEVLQAHLSFPSGHSSWSFCGLGYVSLLFWYTLRSAPSATRRPKSIETFVCAFPLFCAALIAASRTRDNYHHFADVLTGAVLGAAVTISVFWTFYPAPVAPVKKDDRLLDAESHHAPLKSGSTRYSADRDAEV